jgi:hypothetical protein
MSEIALDQANRPSAPTRGSEGKLGSFCEEASSVSRWRCILFIVTFYSLCVPIQAEIFNLMRSVGLNAGNATKAMAITNAPNEFSNVEHIVFAPRVAEC